jgi:hypothetical protein
MSKNINVNPDHYKVAGREHPGEGIHHERNKRELAMREKALERQKRNAKTKKPGARAK